MVWLSEDLFVRYRGFTEVFDKKPWSPSGHLENRISIFDFKLCTNEDLNETSSLWKFHLLWWLLSWDINVRRKLVLLWLYNKGSNIHISWWKVPNYQNKWNFHNELVSLRSSFVQSLKSKIEIRFSRSPEGDHSFLSKTSVKPRYLKNEPSPF